MAQGECICGGITSHAVNCPQDSSVLVFRNPSNDAPVAVPREVAQEAVRAVKAYDLLKSGKTWSEIAGELGYINGAAAKYDYELWHKEAVATVAAASRQDWLRLQVDRMNTLLSYAWPLAQQGNIPAINTALGIVMNQSKLLALETAVAEGDGDTGPKTVIVPHDEDGYLSALQGMG